MTFIQSKNAELFVQSLGQGQPVLQICGMISDVASWIPLTPILQNNFSLIQFDNRGAGRTKCKNMNWTIDDMVADALSVLDHYQIQRAHIVGHSMGGMIGLRLAALHPKRVGAFVSLASLNAPNEKGLQYFKELAKTYASDMPKQQWFEQLLPALYAPSTFSDTNKLKAAAQTAAAYPYLQSSKNFAAQVNALASIKPIEISGISAPTLSLIGEQDRMVKPHRTRESLNDLENITFKTLPNAAHSIHWDAPQEVATVISEFLGAYPL